jgi:uncharacterized membrane protein
MPLKDESELYRPERTLAFSDGVIAVAITLLVLDLKLPPLEHDSDAELIMALIAALPKIGMYALSFSVVSLIWIGHHRKFAYIRRIDSHLIEINFLFLLLVGFVPFVTSVLGDHLSSATATILYAATLAATVLVSWSMWFYAKHSPSLNIDSVPETIERYIVFAPLLNAGIFVASIPVAAFNPSAGRLVWLLLIPAELWARHG